MTNYKKLFLYFFIIIYVFSAVTIFFIYVPNALDGKSKIELFADSETFEQIAVGNTSYVITGIYDTVDIKYNFLGPLLILHFFQMNRIAILFFNLFLFLMGFHLLNKSFEFNKLKLLLLFVINPIIFSSLMSVNKEIFVYFSICLLLRYFSRQTILLALSAIIISFLARWQMAFYVTLLILMCSKFNPFKRFPLVVVIIITISISVLYHRIEIFNEVNSVLDVVAIDSPDGFFAKMNRMQIGSDWGYTMVVIPKAMHLMFGIIKNYHEFMHWQDFYNEVLTYIHGVSMCFVFILLVLSGRFKIMIIDKIDFAWLLFIIIFTISPIYTPRYFLAVYILWAIKISMTKYALLKLTFNYRNLRFKSFNAGTRLYGAARVSAHKVMQYDLLGH